MEGEVLDRVIERINIKKINDFHNYYGWCTDRDIHLMKYSISVLSEVICMRL